jgi:hypothetical protein
MVFCIYKPYVRDLDDQGCSGDLPHLRQHAQCASAVREPNLRNFWDSWDSFQKQKERYVTGTLHVPSGYVKIAIENGHL